MSEGLELRKCASFTISTDEPCKGCKEVQKNYDRQLLEMKENYNRELKEIKNLIKELLGRNHDQRNDLPGIIQAEEGLSSCDQPPKLVTSCLNKDARQRQSRFYIKPEKQQDPANWWR